MMDKCHFAGRLTRDPEIKLHVTEFIIEDDGLPLKKGKI